MPTIVLATSSAAIEKIEVSLESIVHIADNSVLDGPNMFGFYVEGKFSYEEKYGTQNPDTMSPSDFETFHRMWKFSKSAR